MRIHEHNFNGTCVHPIKAHLSTHSDIWHFYLAHYTSQECNSSQTRKEYYHQNQGSDKTLVNFWLHI